MPNKKPFYIFAAYFVLYELTVYLSNDMIMPAMPQVVHQFHASLESVALSLTFFIIGGSILQMFLGPIADVVGKRLVLLLGNLLFLTATIIIPFSGSINFFLAARFFQGMGMCFIFLGYAMIHELFDDIAAVKLTTILSNVSIFAPLAGPIIGSSITAISRWEFVFIVSGILGIISFLGLYRYMPTGKIHNQNFDLRRIIKSYKNIFLHKSFALGISTFGLSMVPLISWIGISPAIILENQHRSFTVYTVYQSIIFGGFVLSSSLVNKFAGQISFYKLISYGGTLSFAGLFIAGTCGLININFVIGGMCIYACGFGLYSGSLMRVALSSTGESMNLSSAAMTLINCIFLSVGLQLCNEISHKFGYTIASFAIINLVIGLLAFYLVRKFARLTKNREWNKTVV